MGLSFHTQWISILFLLSMVWSTIDYGKSINEIIEKKVIAEILCICCIALSIAMAYFVGYIQGAFVSLWKYRATTFRLIYQYGTSYQKVMNARSSPARSSRRRWLAAVLSHHRAYRSVHGGFNSWRAQTDRLWLNHKSHRLSVFLLTWLVLPL